MANGEVVYPGKIRVPYVWSVGEYGSRFLYELKEHKKFWATRCPRCRKVFIPPRKSCPDCFVQIGEWLEVGPHGSLVTFTIVRYRAQTHPVLAPFAIGVIQLDGSDTGLVHLIGGEDIEEISSGMRVKPVFREEREGNLLDILYFTPLEEAS
jgi:uncharacterized OB-fold protein